MVELFVYFDAGLVVSRDVLSAGAARSKAVSAVVERGEQEEKWRKGVLGGNRKVLLRAGLFCDSGRKGGWSRIERPRTRALGWAGGWTRDVATDRRWTSWVMHVERSRLGRCREAPDGREPEGEQMGRLGHNGCS